MEEEILTAERLEPQQQELGWCFLKTAMHKALQG